MRTAAIILGALLLLAARPASADESATVGIAFDPLIEVGDLHGCGIAFDVVRRDPDYFDNAKVQASGSLYLFRFPGKEIGVGVKLGVARLDPADAPYERPAHLYLVRDFETNAGELLSRNEGLNGTTLASFSMGEKTSAILSSLMSTGKFSVGYVMRDGGRLDIFEVDVTAKSAHDASGRLLVERDFSALKKWLSCVGTLMK